MISDAIPSLLKKSGDYTQNSGSGILSEIEILRQLLSGRARLHTRFFFKLHFSLKSIT